MILRYRNSFTGWKLNPKYRVAECVEVHRAAIAWHNLCCYLCRGLNCSPREKVGRNGRRQDAKNLDRTQPFVRYAAQECPPGLGKARGPPEILNLLEPESI